MENTAQNSAVPKKTEKAKNTYQVELLLAGTQPAREVLKEFIWQKLQSGGPDECCMPGCLHEGKERA